MEFNEMITGALSGLIGGGGGYLWGMKRQKKELESLSVENVHKAIRIYQNALDDLSKRFSERISENERQIDLLKSELKKCKEKVSQFINMK